MINTHTHTQMLTAGSVHTKRPVFIIQMIPAATAELCLYCLGWSTWQTVMKWMAGDIPASCVPIRRKSGTGIHHQTKFITQDKKQCFGPCAFWAACPLAASSKILAGAGASLRWASHSPPDTWPSRCAPSCFESLPFPHDTAYLTFPHSVFRYSCQGRGSTYPVSLRNSAGFSSAVDRAITVVQTANQWWGASTWVEMSPCGNSASRSRAFHILKVGECVLASKYTNITDMYLLD